jgi:surface antigen
MTIARMLCALFMAIAVAGCETDPGGIPPRGALGGASAGNVLGSEIGGGKGPVAATAAGTLLGAYQGSAVGKSLDRADRRHAEEAARNGLEKSPVGHTTPWSNPDTGHAGTFTPTNTYHSADDLRCRDYEQDVTVKGQTRSAYGTACQAVDGAWRVVETPVRRALHRRALRRRR